MRRIRENRDNGIMGTQINKLIVSNKKRTKIAFSVNKNDDCLDVA